MTLGQANASVSVIQKLLDVQQTLSPGYTIMWEQALDVLAEETGFRERQVSPETFCFLVRCSIATRINAIGVKHFRDAMADDWMGDDDDFNREAWYNETLKKLDYYEYEYMSLKESTWAFPS